MQGGEKVSDMADTKSNKLNLGSAISNLMNPIKRIIETALSAHITTDNISKKLRDASIRKFRDGLQHLDFLRLDRFDLVQ